ncbi:MAG: ribonuclease H-like domain-containing protein [Limnochordia bacterium]|nr:ribonuclease H-like domain-containing protein [Limnochordia bacterium]
MSLADRLRMFETSCESAPKVDFQALPWQLGGVLQTNQWGTYLLCDAHYPLDYYHGDRQLGSLLRYHGQSVDCISPCFDQKLDLDQLVFLDTETTGLSRGTGTYVFLVGLGYFTETGFRISQYFLPDYSEELAMLSRLSEELGPKTGLVSFNGKAFDVPLLQTRLICQRLPQWHLPKMHMDLLHSARRLWKGTLDSCSLSSLEVNVLGFSRRDDVPGYLIPERYFNYLASCDATPLKEVLRHNRQDILSMVTLTELLIRIYSAPELIDDPKMLMRVAKHRASLGDSLGAEALYAQVLREKSPSSYGPLAMGRLAKIYKRQGKWGPAIDLWYRLIAEGGRFELEPFEELAKYYEHREKDYPQAIKIVNEAICRIKSDPLQRKLNNDSLSRLDYRLERLQRKLG